jgi:SAM-dependent methyltransferase
MMDRLRAKLTTESISLAQADATRLPFPADCFDGVVAVHVFHLIRAWRDVLTEVARILRPGAALVYAHNVDEMPELTEQLRRQRKLYGVENVGVPEEDKETFLIEMGWQPRAEAQQVGWMESFRPSDMLARITGRQNSTSWRMTGEQISHYAQAMRGILDERFGDVEGEYDLPEAFSARAFLPPA